MTNTQNLTKLLILLAFTMLTAGCAQKNLGGPYTKAFWENYYQSQLTPGSKVISAGPNRTVEFINRQYLVKDYFYDTKVVTTTKTYRDEALQIPIGPSVSGTDTGIKTFECNFVNGKLNGPAYAYDSRQGWKRSETNYEKGLLEGKTLLYDSIGHVSAIINYHLDSLDGESIYYMPDGTVKKKELWANGKLLNGEKKDATGFDIQIAPAFPCDKTVANDKKCEEVSLMRYLMKTIRYPSDALELGIQGTAVVTFVVDKDGSIKNVEVIRGYCNSIRNECIRVVSGMPKWTPGSADGQPVKVKYTLPIRFRLE